MKKIKQIQLNVKTSKGIFGIILQKWDGDREYVVRTSRFPEIVTQGSSIKEAKDMAREAIELCLKCEEKETAKNHGYNSYIKSKRPTASATSSRL